MVNLHANGFSVPRPIDHNRHAIMMQLVDGFNLNQVVSLESPEHI